MKFQEILSACKPYWLAYFAWEIMPITFPDFKNAHCFWMTLCAEAPKAGPDLVKWMKGEKDKIAILKTERGKAHVRLMLGGKDGNHVHFDAYSPEIPLPKAKGGPKSKSDQLVELNDIQDSIGRLLGHEIAGRLRVGYRVKIEELPETGIIRAFSFETKMGAVSLKLDGALFSITGAPIQEITWGVRPDGDVSVTLEADSMKTIITEDYLVKANGIAENAFNVFVLGKALNESK